MVFGHGIWVIANGNYTVFGHDSLVFGFLVVGIHQIASHLVIKVTKDDQIAKSV